MAQIRTVAYHSLDTSLMHNQRIQNVVKPGAYAGYRIRRNVADPSQIDLTHGDDGTSVLVTVEGVRVEETDEQLGFLKIQDADSFFSRYDLVVSEYQWTPDNNIVQAYRVVRGSYPSSPDDDPVRPRTQNIYQIPLAWILVRPTTSSSGQFRVDVRQEDIIHAPMASDLNAPYDVSTLKPEIDPTNTKRIFVHEGIFPSHDGSTVIQYGGGYSAEIDDSTMIDNETRYFLVGISDDGEVGVVGSGDTLSTIPPIGTDILPLCIAVATKRGSSTAIDSVIDIRFPFARRIIENQEENLYRELLRSSVFRHVQIDSFDVNTRIDLFSLTPSETDLDAEIDYGDTSLKIEYSGATQPSADVLISTGNILADWEVGDVRHIMVLIDTQVPGVVFDYSSISGYAGFTGAYYDSGTIQEILGGGANELYLRFKIPAAEFDGGLVAKIFSYAVFMALDYDMLNEHSLLGLGIESITKQLENFIPNGDFRIWSRLDSEDNVPDINGRERIDYPIQMDDFGDRKNIFAGDGWQFTKMEFNPNNGVISRILWGRDVLGLVEDETYDFALEWKGLAGTGAAAVNELEFRTLLNPEMEGDFITFAFDYKSDPFNAVGIKLRLYERKSDGSVVIHDEVQSGSIRTDGTLLVKSDVAINKRTFAAGFVIVFQQLTSVTTVRVRRARAALGRFETLPFTKNMSAEDLCQKYVETGKLFSGANLGAGNDIGASIQYSSKKLYGLSEENEVRTQEVESRAVNIGAVTFHASASGFTARASAILDGETVMDFDWISEVIYPEVSS